MTTNLLIFFAIPFAVIVFSIALQKILKNPFLVAGIIFSILLIIVLAFFDTIYLIAVVAYTILSFITAVLTWVVCRWIRNNQICDIICNNDENTEVTTVNDTTNTDFSGVTGCYLKNYNTRR